ncbi:MAG TPA: DUF1707 domain-containing protein [Streptosporangiaceae bacterium]|jgi:hypothetical protein|nr:DUF1707 domain-containing protein [Streptosporangiaceae bacterium]
MTTAPRRFPAGNLRASDSDRDRALAELTEHYQAGRLDADEFDERSGRALQAKTGQELSDLFTDLPAGQQPGTWVDPAVAAGQPYQGVPAQVPPGPVNRRGFGAVAPVIGTVTAVAIVALVVAGLAVNHHDGGHEWSGLVIPLLIVLLIVRRLARTRR